VDTYNAKTQRILVSTNTIFDSVLSGVYPDFMIFCRKCTIFRRHCL